MDNIAQGIYRGIPANEYHKWDALSATRLKSYAANPSTCKEPYIPGDDANMGSGQHAYTLQGQENFDKECLILPPEAEGKSAKAEKIKAEWSVLNPDIVLLPPVFGPAKVPCMDAIKGVDAALRDHPTIAPILSDCETELSLVWIDQATGLKMKCRLDIWQQKQRAIFDLKKSKKIDSFYYQIRERFYYVQAGVYFWGATVCGLDPVAFGFIPFEPVPPYRVECGYVAYLPSDYEEEYDHLRKINECVENAQRLTALYKESTERDYWPNFPVPDLIWTWDELTPEILTKFY
jgi:hypothetical protein